MSKCPVFSYTIWYKGFLYQEATISRATTTEMILREKDIQALIAQGVAVTVMCDELAVKYNVQSRSIYNQYLAIISDIKKSVVEGRDELRAQLMARNDYIYKQALTTGNLKTALDATTAQAKLAGLNELKDQTVTKPTIITLKERGTAAELTIVKEAINSEE